MTDSTPKNHLPHAPFMLVACVFGLALFSLAVVISLLPAWQTQIAAAPSAQTPYFQQTAVILPGQRKKERAQRSGLIITPAQNMPEDLPPFPAKPHNVTRTTPFTAPNGALTPSQTAPIPPISPQTPRWIRNAHPISVPKHHAKIAIVIDDMGVAEANSQAVIDQLPAAVTLAFLPYGEATLQQSKAAFTKGHDIMVHIPMQPHRATANPGPNALYADDHPAQIKRKVRLNLKDLKHISVGANNHMGSKMTESLAGMRAVLEEVEKETLFFLDSVTTQKSSVATARTGLDLPVLQRHIFLDHEVTPEFINNALSKAERYAQKHGAAIVIGHPYPATTNAIKSWLPTLKDKNISLIPISNLLQ